MQTGGDARRAHRLRRVGEEQQRRAELFVGAVAGDPEIGDEQIALGLAHAAQTAERDRVTRCVELIAGADRAFDLDRLRLARRHRDGDEHDAEVHHVSAVAAAAAPEQVRERGAGALAVQRASSADPARELLHDGRDDERRERVREHREGAAKSGRDREQRAARGRDDGRGELPLERGARRAVPRELRPDAHEEQERERERHLDAIEVRSSDGQLRAAQRLRDERVERAEQDGQRRRDEDDVLK